MYIILLHKTQTLQQLKGFHYEIERSQFHSIMSSHVRISLKYGIE